MHQGATELATLDVVRQSVDVVGADPPVVAMQACPTVSVDRVHVLAVVDPQVVVVVARLPKERAFIPIVPDSHSIFVGRVFEPLVRRVLRVWLYIDV